MHTYFNQFNSPTYPTGGVAPLRFDITRDAYIQKRNAHRSSAINIWNPATVIFRAFNAVRNI